MSQANVNKRANYDVATISRKGKKAAYHIQDALHIDSSQTNKQGSFINTISNVFLKREVNKAKAYF